MNIYLYKGDEILRKNVDGAHLHHKAVAGNLNP